MHRHSVGNICPDDNHSDLQCHSHAVGLTWLYLVWLGLVWLGLTWFGLEGARLDADASCLREIHLAPETPFQAPPRHIPGPGGTKLCSPAPILRANCLIINNGRCQVNFTKRCMRVHSGYACVSDVLTLRGHFLACETREWAKTPPQSCLNPSFSGICSARTGGMIVLDDSIICRSLLYLRLQE